MRRAFGLRAFPTDWMSSVISTVLIRILEAFNKNCKSYTYNWNYGCKPATKNFVPCNVFNWGVHSFLDCLVYPDLETVGQSNLFLDPQSISAFLRVRYDEQPMRWGRSLRRQSHGRRGRSWSRKNHPIGSMFMKNLWCEKIIAAIYLIDALTLFAFVLWLRPNTILMLYTTHQAQSQKIYLRLIFENHYLVLFPTVFTRESFATRLTCNNRQFD